MKDIFRRYYLLVTLLEIKDMYLLPNYAKSYSCAIHYVVDHSKVGNNLVLSKNFKVAITQLCNEPEV